MHLRDDAMKAILTAYVGSEKRDYRLPAKMRIKCGIRTVTIKPYVKNKR